MTTHFIQPQSISILGATGSIGRNTLDVIGRHPDRYSVFALSAYRQIDRLLEQCLQFEPHYAVVPDETSGQLLADALKAHGSATAVRVGSEALSEIAAAPGVDAVMAAIVGAAGLAPTLAAARAGKKILLANKEALVMAGSVFMDAVRTGGATLLPIDSEHNAVFQCLPRHFNRDLGACGVRRIVLTASGGPFRTHTLAELEKVTVSEACAHPNWSMGRKISVDSASMMNKGLEVIEACLLFGAPASAVDVLVHPQSVIHSMVEYLDGSVIAELGHPDMRTPIAHALAYPDRIDAGVRALDLVQIGQLQFLPPDLVRFPCLRLAYEALSAGGDAPTVLNAANEIAVEAFLSGELPFSRIPSVIAQTRDSLPVRSLTSLDDVLAADLQARSVARARLSRHTISVV